MLSCVTVCSLYVLVLLLYPSPGSAFSIVSNQGSSSGSTMVESSKEAVLYKVLGNYTHLDVH